jgi:chromate transporter
VIGELAWLFLRLGTTAFGGPAAHIAMMEDEVVRRRQWLTHEELLDLIAACNLIPGPNSTELAIHIGHRKAGWPGLLVAGACFILPAALIVAAIAWAYVQWGALPEVGAVLYGVKPVIIAIVAQAIGRLTRSAVKSWALGAIGVVAIAATVAGVNELVVLLGAGMLAAARIAGARMVGVAPVVPLVKLFAVFAKIGAVLFGSGYVLLAFLRSDLVDRLHWLSESQLLDAVAVGQITPGPVFTTATFIGYLLDGGRGAVVATVGIFLPAFVFVAISGPLVPRIRRSRVAGAFLDGVVIASLALMAVVAVQLGHAAIIDPWTIAILVISVVVLQRTKVSSLVLIVGGAAAGLAIHALGT